MNARQEDTRMLATEIDVALLAAGRGKRIAPFGETLPKALIPVATRPAIEHAVAALARSGVRRAWAGVSGALGDQVRSALLTTASEEGEPRTGILRPSGESVAVEVVSLPQPAGTARTAAALWERASGRWPPVRPLLAVYADTWFAPEDVLRLLEASSRGERAAVLVEPLDGHRLQPNDWIGAEVDQGRLHHILGHARDRVTHRVLGAIVLPTRFARYLDANPSIAAPVQVGQMPPLEPDLAASLALALARGEEVAGVEVSHPAVDMDKPWHILEATGAWMQWARRAASEGAMPLPPGWVPGSPEIHPMARVEGRVTAGQGVRIGPGVVIRGDVWLGDGTLLDNGVVIDGPAVIGRHVVVRDYAYVFPYTAIGDGCRVGHAAEVAGVLMEGVYAVHYMEFYGVIGRHSDLGAATVCGTLRFDDRQTPIRVQGRTEVPWASSNAAFIGDFSRTGVNVTIYPGRRIGPYSCVGPGVVVDRDVPARTLVTATQTWQEQPWGPERYGW